MRLLLVACALLASASAWARPPVVVVSYDGFRGDYLYRPEAAWFRRFARDGVRARRLLPPFPSKTYPSHYSMATGRYPSAHGIVANTMWDPARRARFTIPDRAAVRDGRWWGAEPVWTTAARHGLRTFVYFWPGSEAAIDGRRPDRWFPYDGATSFDEQVTTVLGWLELPEEERPDLVMVYFREPDQAGHLHGPGAPEVDAALAELSRVSRRLVEGVAARAPGAEVLLVSDHGMASVDPARVIPLDRYVDVSSMTLVDAAPMASLWPGEVGVAATLEALEGAHPAMRCGPPEELPQRWRYTGHPRIAPVVCVAAEGWQIVESLAAGPPRARGMHGYPPEVPSMGGLFLARGPSFRRGRVVASFPNVTLYPLLCRLLGVEPAPHDADPAVLDALLRPRR